MDRRPPQPVLDKETWEVLLDLAKASREDDFRWLARSVGVLEHQLGEMWRGTVARLGKE